MKEKKLELKKIEMVKQDTFERVNRKKTKPEALISNREKEMKEESKLKMIRNDSEQDGKIT